MTYVSFTVVPAAVGNLWLVEASGGAIFYTYAEFQLAQEAADRLNLTQSGTLNPMTTQELLALAYTPEALLTGIVTRSTHGAATSATFTWSDGTPGTYTGTESIPFPGTIDSYIITYGSPVQHTYTQATMTRDASGNIITRPAIVVT